MLWYKAWLETRWRFLAGLVLLMVSAAGIVLSQPYIDRLLDHVPQMGGRIGEMLNQAIALNRSYRGYVWSQWFAKNLPQLWTVLAVLLGTGSLLSETAQGSALFTLALPATRKRLVAIRVATGALESLALAVVPSLLIPALSPAIGQRYGLGPTLIYSLCLAAGGMVFFSFACLLSTEFADIWKPLLIGVAVAALIGLAGQLFPEQVGVFSPYSVMVARKYFSAGVVPWPGLVACLAVSSALVYASTMRIVRRDF